MKTTQVIAIPHQAGILTAKIKAKHPLAHYLRHYPRADSLHYRHQTPAHAQGNLTIVQRVIAFMDRYDLISCLRRQRSLQSLSVDKVVRRRYLKPVDQICVNGEGWDHVSYWRRKDDKAPRVILSEPYHISEDTIRSYDELAERFSLEYHIRNDHGLWNPPDTTAVLWHRSGEHLIEPQYAAKAA